MNTLTPLSSEVRFNPTIRSVRLCLTPHEHALRFVRHSLTYVAEQAPSKQVSS
jgi:hypothetical protein